MTQDVPEWFRRAIDAKPEHHDIDVEGTSVHYRAWGPTGGPGVVLLHGGGAHSGWWDHIAPLLAVDRRIIAPDLTGHGDSARRPQYVRSVWAEEAVAVSEAAGLTRPTMVGHSMGGWVAVYAGVLHPDAMQSIIAIDSPLDDEPPEESPLRPPPQGTAPKVYARREDAVARFRTVPPQESMLAYVADHVALESLREVEGGWTWKFDIGIFGDRVWHRGLLDQLDVPIILLRCEKGLVSPEMATRMAAKPSGGMSVLEIEGAGHHAMFDQPLAVVAALQSLLPGGTS
jgi:pimeloyl-ACP methyl ester carboxylesterase